MAFDQVWRTELDTTLVEPPTVANGTVYAATKYGIEAFDANTGTQEWTGSIVGDSMCQPVYGGGHLFHGTDVDRGTGRLYAFDANTGMEDWQIDGPREGLSDVRGIAVLNDTVYASMGVSMVALDIVDASEQWMFHDPDDGVFGAPVVAGDVVCAAHSSGQVYAFDTASGDAVWSLGLTGHVEESTNDPVTDGETLYVGDSESLVAVDPTTGQGKWSATVDGNTEAPAVDENRVYVGGMGSGRVDVTNTVTALDKASGEVQWSEPGIQTIDNSVSPPSVGPGGIYVTDEAGFLFEVDPENGNVRRSIELFYGGFGRPTVTETAAFVGLEYANIGDPSTMLYAVDLVGEGREEPVSVDEEPPPGFEHRTIEGSYDATGGTAGNETAGPEGATDSTEPGTECPSCGEPLEGDEAFCPGCGEDLSSAAATCPECDTDLDGDEAFCPECGHALSE